MMDKISWGIIGCGNVTELKSGPAFNKVTDSTLIAVMRRDAEKAADYAHRHQVPKYYTDVDSMFADKEINAIYIATPPSFHADYVIRALKRGLPVYVEKPFTLNAIEAERIAGVIREENGKLSIAHYRRALPMFLFIKELIEKKAVGDIRTVQMRLWKCCQESHVNDTVIINWRLQPNLSGGGYFHDLAPHQLDLMLYFFGEVAYYHGFALNQAHSSSADDHVCGQILFKNHVVVNGSWCFNVAEEQTADICEIVGTNGKISFPVFGNKITWNVGNDDVQSIIFQQPEHIQQPMIQQVVAYFRNEQGNPSGVEDAVTLMKIMDAFTTH